MLRLCPAARPVIPGLAYRWVYPGGFSAVSRTNPEKSMSDVRPMPQSWPLIVGVDSWEPDQDDCLMVLAILRARL